MTDDAHALFDALVPQFEAMPDVAMNRMFGTVGLAVRTKVFAFVASSDVLMLKVGVATADELERDGIATRAEMRGRTMREWVEVTAAHAARWPELMERARAYLDEITPR